MKSDPRIVKISSALNQSVESAAAAVQASEWEDNILFDEDDPDFVNSSTTTVLLNGRHPGVVATTVLNSVIFKGR